MDNEAQAPGAPKPLGFGGGPPFSLHHELSSEQRGRVFVLSHLFPVFGAALLVYRSQVSSVNLPDDLDGLRSSLFALLHRIAASSGTILADLLAAEHRDSLSQTPIVGAGTGYSPCYDSTASPPAAAGSGGRATSYESCTAFGRSDRGLGPSPRASLSTGTGTGTGV